MPVELKKNVKSINESVTSLVNTNTCHAGSEVRTWTIQYFAYNFYKKQAKSREQ